MGGPNPERILIHAPYGRDAAILAQVLEGAGMVAEICATVEGLVGELKSEAGAVLIADEALRAANVTELGRTLQSQERWSDLPVIVLTGEGEATDMSRYRLQLLKPLGNVNLLQRPLRRETAISAGETALRARRRQYEVRDLLKSLEKANAELTSTNRELQEFAYVASHDLQEPLRMVNIYTEMILRNVGGEPQEDLQKYADFVHKGVRTMETLLRDLLWFSRVGHSEEARPKVANLAAAVDDAMMVLQSRIEEAAAEIECGDLPHTAGDQAQYTQVFTNLISNSLKYRKANEAPRIAISAEPDDGRWVVCVADNGIGFEQRHAERIFGLFKRLHKDEYRGTGIGLAICKRIVERHGGRIWAESEPGRGARFYLTVSGLNTHETDTSTVGGGQ